MWTGLALMMLDKARDCFLGGTRRGGRGGGN